MKRFEKCCADTHTHIRSCWNKKALPTMAAMRSHKTSKAVFSAAPTARPCVIKSETKAQQLDRRVQMQRDIWNGGIQLKSLAGVFADYIYRRRVSLEKVLPSNWNRLESNAWELFSPSMDYRGKVGSMFWCIFFAVPSCHYYYPMSNKSFQFPCFFLHPQSKHILCVCVTQCW